MGAGTSGVKPLLNDDSLFAPSPLKTGAFEVKELPADAAQAAWDAAVAAQEAGAQASEPPAASAGSSADAGDFAKTDLVQLDFPPTDIAPLA